MNAKLEHATPFWQIEDGQLVIGMDGGPRGFKIKTDDGPWYANEVAHPYALFQWTEGRDSTFVERFRNIKSALTAAGELQYGVYEEPEE
jgi:hypothetical protein